jgi:integrase
VAHYGRAELFRALGTADPQRAAQRCREAAYAMDQEWAALRAERATKYIPSASQVADSIPATVTTQALDQMSLKKAKASQPIDPLIPATKALANLRRMRDEVAQQGPEKLEGWIRDQHFHMSFHEAVLTGGEIPVWSMSQHEGYRNAYRALLTGEGAMGISTSPAAVVRAPVSVPATPKADRQHHLHAIFDCWKNAQQRLPKTVDDYSRSLTRFIESSGETMITSVTRQNVIAFRTKLQSEGLAPASVNKSLAAINVLMMQALNDGLIDNNPARNVSVKADRHAKEARLPFDLLALKAIFAGPVHTEQLRPKAGAGEAAYWLPILALYTGARLEELGQLHPEDVAEEAYLDDQDVEQKVWVFSFTDRGEGQGLKNAGSRRRIPVHPKLIELGFVDFVKGLQEEDRARIFHHLNSDVYGHETGNWSKWFSRYLRGTCGVTDKRMVFHSFRHAFKDNCRDAGIPTEVSNAFTGHSSGDVADNYGGKFPLKLMVKAMEKYRVPGFALLV